ncbi:hypothetical protein EOI86_10810 [Hwanghaeella grinnelliae]|uniref:Uncharacterized protein n=1 Tax=Hwanghaeella grinnelliae TaxID=2500179 RepID=A0A3S2Z7U9_9PROT|nr:hypothetical protein [Hwanghaeella grinnelliae]RVU35753.1 hypothetical protein EOI86_10810 [Hwanghaeella grinnelliae]
MITVNVAGENYNLEIISQTFNGTKDVARGFTSGSISKTPNFIVEFRVNGGPIQTHEVKYTAHHILDFENTSVSVQRDALLNSIGFNLQNTDQNAVLLPNFGTTSTSTTELQVLAAANGATHKGGHFALLKDSVDSLAIAREEFVLDFGEGSPEVLEFDANAKQTINGLVAKAVLI